MTDRLNEKITQAEWPTDTIRLYPPSQENPAPVRPVHQETLIC